MENTLEKYKESMEKYRRALACRRYKEALTHIEVAIDLCPVNEALHCLQDYRDSVEKLTKSPIQLIFGNGRGWRHPL